MVNRKHGLSLRACILRLSLLRVDHLVRVEDYQELHKYSVDSHDFWLDVWEFIGIISSIPPTKVAPREPDLMLRWVAF